MKKSKSQKDAATLRRADAICWLMEHGDNMKDPVIAKILREQAEKLMPELGRIAGVKMIAQLIAEHAALKSDPWLLALVEDLNNAIADLKKPRRKAKAEGKR